MAPVKTHSGRILSWATDVDENTMQQAERTAALPFVAGHLALMPDAHWGMGATIGSVIPTRGAVIPAAVGVDIGCGMIAAETIFTSASLPDTLGPLHGLIRAHVPAGMGRGHERSQLASDAVHQHYPGTPAALDSKLAQKALAQFGTLGSGNHFVEVCLDERDVVWVVLHSGSRGIGHALATRHIDAAKKMMARYFVELADPDLAYLVEGTPEFGAYIVDMLWAQEYAAGNREAMMDSVLDCLAAVIGDAYDPPVTGLRRTLEVARVNCHHNYAALEHHHGRDVWLTRKGAIRARAGDRGVIPGSMGTSSFIVRGLGNPAAYDSCSHGAGRRMSRGQARRTLDVEGLRAAMEGKVWNDRDAVALLDEDPRSYKNVDEVMASQSDLVTVEHTLHQVLNYKGT